jgi:hypothetical protein
VKRGVLFRFVQRIVLAEVKRNLRANLRLDLDEAVIPFVEVCEEEVARLLTLVKLSIWRRRVESWLG